MSTPLRIDRSVGPVAIVWAVVYVYLGVAAIPATVSPPGRWDLAAHAVATALLAALLLEWRRRPAPRSAGTFAFVAACLLGLAVEIVQAMVPHRGFELADLAADAVGAAVAVLVVPRLAAVAPRVTTAMLVVAGGAASVAALVLTTAG
ncbi:MAG: VanZ family protein [Actinomycetes bacterium]